MTVRLRIFYIYVQEWNEIFAVKCWNVISSNFFLDNAKILLIFLIKILLSSVELTEFAIMFVWVSRGVARI